ncbi:MAG: discoidin domain-containing protein, partial [Pseudomonadales bacterium]
MVNRYIRSLAVGVAFILSFSVLAADATRIQLIAHIPIAPPAEPALLSATATASSSQNSEGAGPPSYAVDGNNSTRWGSLFTNNQWLKLDLGSPHALTEVIIRWEAANAASYRIEGSTNNTSWTTLSTHTGGSFGNRIDTKVISGSYRYVRMQGIARSSNWGYSIFEMKVFGLPAADSDNDGVDDSNDQCPGTSPGASVDANGCVPVDTDNDGVIDSEDTCPNTPAGSNVNANGCAISDADNDGVLDGLDQCANTPSGDIVGPDGCTVVLDGIEVSSVNGLLVGGPASSKPGYVLYVFDNDLSAPGSSNCTGGCATNWPPLMVTDGLASGVNNLASISRAEGQQVVYNGRPLYYYIGDNNVGDDNGDGAGGVWHTIELSGVEAIEPLYNSSTALEQITSYVRSDGVVVTRFGDRGRDRHAKDIGYYDPNNIYNSDHYDHWLAHYWEYRTARVQFEDHVPNGQSLIKATYITESRLGAKEFRVWFSGITTTGQFHWNPTAVQVDSGTFNNDFVKTSSSGHQYKYVVDITTQWKNVATFNTPLSVGTNMEFEISQ